MILIRRTITGLYLTLSGAVLALALLSSACAGKTPQISMEEAIKQGDEAMSQKKFGAAVSAYETAVALGGRGEVRVKLAYALRGAQRWDPAARQFITASEEVPDNWDYQVEAVEWMLSLLRYYDATVRATTLLAQKPDDPRLLMYVGLAKAQLKSAEFGLWELEGEMLKGRHFEGARIRLSPSPFSKPDPDAEAKLRKAYELAPDSFNTRLALAGFLWIYGRHEDGTALLKITADKDPKYVQANRALGLYYDYREKFEDAEKYLRIAAAGGDRVSALALADFFSRRKRFADALAVLEPLAATDDPSSGALARAADAELALGRNEAALKRADDVLKKKQFDPTALRVKANVLLASGDNMQALALARSAVGSAPASREAHLTLARALDMNGDLSAAFTEYSEVWRGDMRDAAVAKSLAGVALALGRDGVAEDLGNQSLRLSPGDKEAAVITARANVRLGDLAGAERALAPFAAGKSMSADMLALEGTIEAARGKTDAARSAFMKALQLDRNSIDALTGLVDLEINGGRVSSLKAQVDQAAAAHAGHPAYLLLTARIAAAEKDMPRAEKSLRQILDKDAAREDAARLYASILAAQGRLTDAQSAIEKSLEKVPTSVLLRLELGDLLERQAKFQEARTQYERIIQDNQIAGGTTETLTAQLTGSSRLARLFANQGTNLDEALQLASSAMRYRPKNAAFVDTLGWVHVRKQRARLGLPYLETALKAEPGNALVRYHLGVAYDQLGEVAKARQELAEALRIDPGFSGADAARTLLKALGK